MCVDIEFVLVASQVMDLYGMGIELSTENANRSKATPLRSTVGGIEVIVHRSFYNSCHIG